MKSKDFLTIAGLQRADLLRLIERAGQLKSEGMSSVLSGMSLALLFEKPSLRTRVSFEMAMRQMGGYALYLSPAEVGLGEREPVKDVARVLSRYVDAIAARTFAHSTLEELARLASVPVINALSDLEHPCQAVGDFLTMFEKMGTLEGKTLAFIGDGNNVAHSLLLGASLLGVNFNMAVPSGYHPAESVLDQARVQADQAGARIELTDDPAEAVKGADIVYTDVWTSMGQEQQSQERREAFAGYQVDAALMAKAKDDAIVMHDLPAHRGEEITDEVMESSASVVFDQVENRLHAQKAILFELLGG